MSDLIDRQAAIEALAELARERFTLQDYFQIYLDALKDADIKIRQLPSAQPDVEKMQDIEQAMLEKAYECGMQDSGQWIPCSERLPEVGRSVLLSVGGMYTAEGCLREDGDWTQFRWDAIQRKDMVGAWMPLLEPYAERRTDGSKNE